MSEVNSAAELTIVGNPSLLEVGFPILVVEELELFTLEIGLLDVLDLVVGLLAILLEKVLEVVTELYVKVPVPVYSVGLSVPDLSL